MVKELEIYNILAGAIKGQTLISIELRDVEGEKYVCRALCRNNYTEYIKKAFARMQPVTLPKKEEKVKKLVRSKRGS